MKYLVTLHRMNELNEPIGIRFYLDPKTEGQLFTHTYSYHI